MYVRTPLLGSAAVCCPGAPEESQLLLRHIIPAEGRYPFLKVIFVVVVFCCCLFSSSESGVPEIEAYSHLYQILPITAVLMADCAIGYWLGTNSQSEGYSRLRKWLIWLVCGEPL